jgi:hypothetical protein
MPRCGRWPCPSRLAAWRPHPSASCSPVGLGGAKRYPINASVRERWVSLRSTHPTQIRLRVLAALIARGLHLRLSLRNLEGAGKTGCLLHPRSRVRFAQTKVHTSIQGSESIPAFPAQWLYGLLRALPGERLFCLRRRERSVASPGLSASTAAPEPHDFAVRSSRTRQSQLLRPSHLTARS